MGTYWGIPLIFLAVVLQSTIFPSLRILGGQPDLAFLLVLAWSINGRLDQNVTWAFVGGIAQDLLSVAPTGASVLGMILLVFAIDRIKQQVYRIGFVLIVGLVIAGTVLQKVIFMIISGVFRVRNFTHTKPDLRYSAHHRL